MTQFQRIFVVSDVADVHRLFAEAFRAAREADRALAAAGLATRSQATLAELRAAYLAFNDGLRTHAQATAHDADRRMKRILKDKQVRPDTGLSPHLSSLIKSRPVSVIGHGIETGAVGIASEDSLNKAINPTSPQYGPYWRAQEYGTGSPEVVSQIGRTIYGYFYGTGLVGPSRPQSQYAGGRGPHPIFVSSSSAQAAGAEVGISNYGGGKRGGKGGKGVIQKEIEGKHFIRDGANEALAEWRLGMRQIEQSTISRLQSVVSPRTPGRRRAQRRRRRF